MEPSEGDSPTVSQVKAAIRDNLEDRYSDCEDFLLGLGNNSITIINRDKTHVDYDD